MKDVYPEFADEVMFYAVGQDPTETVQLMEEYRIEQGYPWPVAATPPKTLQKLRVLQTSTKLAFDSQGVITYRAKHGEADPDTWRKVFRDLAATAQQ
jgi:hypothetical protein